MPKRASERATGIIAGSEAASIIRVPGSAPCNLRTAAARGGETRVGASSSSSWLCYGVPCYGAPAGAGGGAVALLLCATALPLSTSC